MDLENQRKVFMQVDFVLIDNLMYCSYLRQGRHLKGVRGSISISLGGEWYWHHIIFFMEQLFHNGYSSESNQQELSNEYQHDKVKMVFKNLWVVA